MSSLTRTGEIRRHRQGKVARAKQALKSALKKERIDERIYQREMSRLSTVEREGAAEEILALYKAPPTPPPAPKPELIAPAESAYGETAAVPKLSPAKLKALAAARAARKSAQRSAPTGYRSVDHFLDSVAEKAGRRFGGQADLSRYLNVGTKTVSRWLSRQKIPVQANLDAMALWMQLK